MGNREKVIIAIVLASIVMEGVSVAMDSILMFFAAFFTSVVATFVCIFLDATNKEVRDWFDKTKPHQRRTAK